MQCTWWSQGVLGALLLCACDGAVEGKLDGGDAHAADDAAGGEGPTRDASALDAVSQVDAYAPDAASVDASINHDGGIGEPGAHVFDRAVLHEVLITVSESDRVSLDQRTDMRVPATLVFDGVTLERVGVRNKGQSSFQPTSQKPGFSIKLDELVQGQRLDGMKKLTLNNTVQDPTWCNEILTYDTYRRAGLPAPRVAHAVVSLNGEPKGIYTIIEPINDQFLARHYGADMDQGNLYEGPWDFTKSVDDADLKDEDEMRTRDDLRALTEVVLSTGDATYPDRLATLLDVDQFIRGQALDVVTAAWDGYGYCAWNFYMYDHPRDDRFVFLPSGANWPYFRDALESAVVLDPLQLPQLWSSNDPVGFLANERILAIAPLRERLVDQLRDVTMNAFDVSALHAEFDRLRTVLHSTQRTDDATQRDLDTFDDHVDMAYDFVARRKAYLLTQLP